jgi:hypothetical protein
MSAGLVATSIVSAGMLSAGFGPILLAGISACLIAGGIYMTWRDVRTRRTVRPAALPEPRTRDPVTTNTTNTVATGRLNTVPPAAASQSRTQPTTGPNTQPKTSAPTQPIARLQTPHASPRDVSAASVTIVKREPVRSGSHDESVTARRDQSSAPKTSAFADLRTSVDAILAETADSSDAEPEGQRWPSVEARWAHIEREIDQAVAQLNNALKPVGLELGKAGEIGWSFKNRGFGSYRRIGIGGRSIGWLRAETNQEHQLICKVRAHATDHALLNASAQIPAQRLDATLVLDLIAKVLHPSANYAAWLAPKARAASADGTDDAWSAIAPVAASAYAVAAGALKEADASLAEIAAPAWDPATGRHRWALAVAVGQSRVVDIMVDLSKHGLEVASRPLDQTKSDLGRRRRLDLPGLDAHALAEAIAASAWPAVAEALERAQPANA